MKASRDRPVPQTSPPLYKQCTPGTRALPILLKGGAMNERRRKRMAILTVAAMLGGQLGSPRLYAAKKDEPQEESRAHGGHQRTATPIKHVIVLIGENRTFDN